MIEQIILGLSFIVLFVFLVTAILLIARAVLTFLFGITNIISLLKEIKVLLEKEKDNDNREI